MIAMVFLLIGANLLFTCFSFQGNAKEISSEIVNVPVLTQFELTIPVHIAKHYLTFFQNAANRCLLYRICCLYCFISKSETVAPRFNFLRMFLRTLSVVISWEIYFDI